eukprot:g17637.t1
MPFWTRKSQAKGTGKARGQHIPGNKEDTFGNILNDNRGAGARTGRGAGAAAAADAGAAGASAATAQLTPLSDRDGGGRGGFKSSGRKRGEGGQFHGHGGGGGSTVRSSGGQSFQWGRVDHVAGTGGGGWRGGGGGGGRRRGDRAWIGDGGGGFDDGSVRETAWMVLFWKEPACFAQWTPCSFELEGVRYCSAEQWMMASKAKLFNDREIYKQIMATSDPREQKALGRKVRGFDPALWDKQGYDVVVEGNLAKFRQNPRFREELLATEDRILAEASPYDSEWGIGLHASDTNALVQARWPGKNKLGEALMDVRCTLRAEAFGGGRDSDDDEGDGGDDDDIDIDKEDNSGAPDLSDEDWVMGERGWGWEGRGNRAGKRRSPRKIETSRKYGGGLWWEKL